MARVAARKAERVILGCAILAMVAIRLIMVTTGFDPAYDQSMLLANFPLARMSDLLQPLPYFEQTTTLGHGFLLDLLAQGFGPEGMARIHAIRALSALTFCAALFGLYHLLRGFLTSVEALFSIVVIGNSPTALTFAVNSKHYGFEFAATVLMLGAALHYLGQPSLRRAMVVMLAGVFVGLFAFVAPITIAAIGVTTLVVQMIDATQRQMTARQIWCAVARTLAVGAVLGLIILVFYLGYTRKVTLYDLTAFSERDSRKFIEIGNLLSSQSLRVALDYGTYLFKFIEIGAEEFETPDRLKRVAMATPALMLYVIGVVVLWKRAPFWVAAAIAAPALTLALNLAQHFPFSGVRQHLFAAPMIAPVMVVGVMHVVRCVTSRLMVPQYASHVLYLIILTSFVLSAVGAVSRGSTVSRLVDEIDASGAPVWAYYGAQPLLRTLRPDWMTGADSPVEGLLSHRSSNQRWVNQARFEDDAGMLPSYYSSARDTIARHDRLWLVFSLWQFDVARTESLEIFLQHARGPGRDCAIWSSHPHTMVAFCGSTEEVTTLRARTPPDQGAAWNEWTKSGDWRQYVKGETGMMLR